MKREATGAQEAQPVRRAGRGHTAPPTRAAALPFCSEPEGSARPALPGAAALWPPRGPGHAPAPLSWGAPLPTSVGAAPSPP